MIKRFLTPLTLFMVLICMNSCEKLDNITEFEITETATFEVPSSNTAAIPDPLHPNVSSSSEQEFESNNTNKKHVEEIRLKDLTLKIQEPEGHTFDFLKSITIYIKTDNLPEKKLAYRDNVPDDVGDKLKLKSTGDNFAEYVKQDQYSLKVTYETESGNDKLDVKATMLFGVKAKII